MKTKQTYIFQIYEYECLSYNWWNGVASVDIRTIIFYKKNKQEKTQNKNENWEQYLK